MPTSPALMRRYSLPLILALSPRRFRVCGFRVWFKSPRCCAGTQGCELLMGRVLLESPLAVSAMSTGHSAQQWRDELMFDVPWRRIVIWLIVVEVIVGLFETASILGWVGTHH